MNPRMLRSLLLALVIPTVALAQTTLPAKKVVFTGTHRLSEHDFRELRSAAPSLNIVVATRETLMNELPDADAVIGGLNKDQFLAAKKLRWMQITSAGVENYLNVPEIKGKPNTSGLDS